MPVEVGLWRVDSQPERIRPSAMPLEARLEQLILDDPEILETKLLLIGNQVPTKYGKYIDVLGLDSEGTLHILELKRDRTPRDVVAQALDYASWVQDLGNDDVRNIYATNNPGKSLDEAFADRFEGAPVPDALNSRHEMTIVASDLDPATERIVAYLNTSHAVPINVMKFRFFSDNGRDYLARTWLIDDTSGAGTPATSRNKSTLSQWDGRDWYVAFGAEDVESPTRFWQDARTYGFISAGGGEWYSRTLKSLQEGAQIFVHVPQHGYVGIGVVQGSAVPADEATLTINGETLDFRALPLQGTYRHSADGDRDIAEYVVPVAWLADVPLDDAVWRSGLFSNQNSACKLRNQFTIDELTREFGLTDSL